MSRWAAAPQQKPEPSIRRARFAEEDLVSTFGEAMLAEARRLLGAGAVDLTTTGRAIEATIVADGEHRRVVLNPTQTGPRVAFLGTCEPTPFPQAQRAHEPALGEAACVHRAAAALAVLERDPTWRRPVQHSLFDLAFTTAPKRHIVFALEPGKIQFGLGEVGVGGFEFSLGLLDGRSLGRELSKIAVDVALFFELREHLLW